MKHLNRDGFTINLIQKGDTNQTPIVVIGSSIYYPRLFSDDVYKDLHLIFVDHRGFLEPQQDNTYELDQIVDDINAVIDSYGYDSVYVLGHSGHGFMAMAYTEKYPERVLGVILSNLAPTNTKERQQQSIDYFETTASQERKEYFYKEISKLESDIEQDPNNRFSHMNIRMQAHSFYDYTFDGAYLWDGVYNNLDALDYLWGIAFANYDTSTFIKTCDKPILLLLSDYDYLVAPNTLWEPIIKDTQVVYHKFDKSGHNPMLEEAHKYHKLLSEFINY